MALQWAHIAYILRWTIIANEGSFRLGVFSCIPPFAFSNMFLVTRDVRYMTFSHSSFLPLGWGFLFFGPIMGPFLLFLVFPFHWVLWLNKVLQGFISPNLFLILLNLSIQRCNVPIIWEFGCNDIKIFSQFHHIL